MRFFSENSMRVDRNSTTEKSVIWNHSAACPEAKPGRVIPV
jgi:hypothetical protein